MAINEDMRASKQTAASTKRRVLLVDDHPIVRHGIGQLINQESDLMVCGEAEDTQQAMSAIQNLRPDIVIVDISLKRGSGIDLVKNVRDNYENLPTLVVSMHDESLYAERVLRAGARGYLTKQEAIEKVLTAIRRVLKGEIYLSDRMTGKMLFKITNGRAHLADSPIEHLSDRELEVFRLIGSGRGTRQIAGELHLSIKTVETYREHIKDKLHLKDASELVQHAVQWVQCHVS
ncbi:MAG: response regulator transcription factor [Verrucomicrobiae bacterium]|nr:response regulator transcription factor [Verrucomicrobiae bacterium]